MKNRLQFLRDNVGFTNAELADEMGIDETYVQAMRVHNGLTKDEVFSLNDEEKELLKEMYPTADWRELFEAFPHLTEPQIKKRAHNLGVRRR